MEKYQQQIIDKIKFFNVFAIVLLIFMTIGLAHHKLEEAQSHKQATIDQIVPPHGASD